MLVVAWYEELILELPSLFSFLPSYLILLFFVGVVGGGGGEMWPSLS